MIRFLLILFLAVSLSACQQQKDQAYYLKNPAKLKSILKHCDAQASPDVSCQQSYKMGQSLDALIRHVMRNQQEAGQEILQVQMKSADLQQQLHEAQSSGDQSQISSLKEQVLQARSQVEAYRAVVGMFMRF